MRAVIARWLCAAVIAAGLSSPAHAQDCYQRDHIAAYLQSEHAMTLRGWGIDINGNMLELFIADGGRFAMITTQPNKCSTMIWAEHHAGRLVDPPRHNRAIPPAPMLDRGQGL